MGDEILHLGKFKMDEKGLYVPLREGGRARPVEVRDGKLVFADLPRQAQKDDSMPGHTNLDNSLTCLRVRGRNTT
ncbi:MAG: hypothetical protein HY427_00440 [Candidatus Levybacteria bacterium]|nr:hypothetical protein [Candidatus Levybacteria bacterium]